MDQVLLGVSLWLHALATVILIGQYVLFGLVYLPIFSRQLEGAALKHMIEAVMDRVNPWVFGSLAVFIVTGIYLMMSDEQYQGIGDFSNAWSALMLVKHVVVVVMVGIGLYMDRVVVNRLVNPDTSETVRTASLRQLAALARITLVCGVVVLLLTAAAQAS